MTFLYTPSIYYPKTPCLQKQNSALLLSHEDGLEVDLSCLEPVNGLLDTLLCHGVLLDDGLDLVQRRELEHYKESCQPFATYVMGKTLWYREREKGVLKGRGGGKAGNKRELTLSVQLAGRNNGALHGDTGGQQGHVGDAEVAVGDGQRVDGGARGHDGHELFPVWLGASGDQQPVELAAHLELLDALGRDELVGTQAHGLLLLGVAARDDNDARTDLVGELDGDVAQATNADDAHRLGGSGVVLHQGGPDSGTGAHERCGIDIAHAVGDLEEEGLPPDGVGGERALVKVLVSVHDPLGAVLLVAGLALLAVLARVVLVSPANAVALLQALAEGPDLLDDTNTLVSEHHVGMLVVQVCSAETRGRHLQEDKIASELVGLGGGALLDDTGLVALVDSEGRHGGSGCFGGWAGCRWSVSVERGMG